MSNKYQVQTDSKHNVWHGDGCLHQAEWTPPRTEFDVCVLSISTLLFIIIATYFGLSERRTSYVASSGSNEIYAFINFHYYYYSLIYSDH